MKFPGDLGPPLGVFVFEGARWRRVPSSSSGDATACRVSCAQLMGDLSLALAGAAALVATWGILHPDPKPKLSFAVTPSGIAVGFGGTRGQNPRTAVAPVRCTGRVNQNRLPAPGELITPISPPCASTMSRAMDSPSPAPPWGAPGIR